MKKAEVANKPKLERIIGVIEGAHPGPTVIAVGGMHGNEHAGVRALEEVFSKLEGQASKFCGKILAVCGNLAALRRGVRYIDEDMNRIWLPEIIDDVRRKSDGKLESSERSEIKHLLKILDNFVPDNPDSPVIFLDLHSFSAAGKMVALTAAKEDNIRLFSRLGVPLIFGVLQVLQGAALNHYHKQGWITVALEGGQHYETTTIQNIIASVMVTLSEVGCLRNITVSDVPFYENYLAQRTKHLPAQVELVYRHLIKPEDHFEMRPGYENFQPVEKGEWLATDCEGKIKAKSNGYLLMPLYQQQGNDGFFFTRVLKDE